MYCLIIKVQLNGLNQCHFCGKLSRCDFVTLASTSQTSKNLLKSYCYRSLYLDESIYIRNINQLSIFARRIDNKFMIYEELLVMVSLHGIRQGKDTFQAFRGKMEEYDGFAKYSTITTNGAKVMVGQEKELRRLLKKMESLDLHSIASLIRRRYVGKLQY
jgi:hypothetical protein